MPSYRHRNETAMSGLSSREKPGLMGDRKTEMCSIFDVYESVFAKEWSVEVISDVQRKERSSY